MTAGRHISEDDLTLYAMRAFSTEESAEVREHLGECEICRDELGEITGELVLVALSVEQQAVPEGARERLMARISPGAGEGSAGPAGRNGAAGRRRFRFGPWIGIRCAGRRCGLPGERLRRCW